MAYSEVADLLIGDIPLGTRVDPQKFVNEATDEVDSQIGVLYETPIEMNEAGPVARHARLLLKRVANHLASGRLILALAAGDEDTTVHAYGMSMVREARGVLNQIAAGLVDLPGATKHEVVGQSNGASIKNYDEFSGVDAFYDMVMRVDAGVTPPRWAPGPG